jgi:hypothetical protein
MLWTDQFSAERLTDILLELNVATTCQAAAERLREARVKRSWDVVGECADTLADLSRYLTAKLIAEQRVPVKDRHEKTRVKAELLPLVEMLKANPDDVWDLIQSHPEAQS